MSRPLSSIEHAIWLVDSVVSQSFTMNAQISGHLSENALRLALDLIQKKFPPLNWKIKDGDIPMFVSENVPSIPLRIIERKCDDQWIEEAEREIEEQFPWTLGPLARVVLIKSDIKCDLIFTFCHIASDATAGVMVMKNLLNIVSRISAGETISIHSPLPEPLSSIELLRKDLYFEKDFSEVSGNSCEETLISAELKAEIEVVPEERKTRIVHRTLSQHETKELVGRCKEENTSVHTALCAAFLQTLVELIKKEQGEAYTGSLRVGCITPVNIRHLFSNTSEEDIGYYISFASHYQLIDNNSTLWEAAKEIKAAINTEIKSGRDVKAIQGVGEALKIFPSPIDLVRAINSSNPPVAVSNLGRLSIPERFGSLILDELNFTVGINPDAKSGFAITVTTYRGRMTLNFHYSEPFISKKRTDIIVDNTMRRLYRAINGAI